MVSKEDKIKIQNKKIDLYSFPAPICIKKKQLSAY